MIAPQERDDGGLGWLFQLVAVFVFFVLPVIRSIAEGRKRAAGKPPRPKAPPRSAGRPDGGELWRELLEGRRPQPTKRAQAPQPVARRALASPPIAPPSTERAAEAPGPALAPGRPRLEPLAGPRVAPQLAPAVSELASPELDPATLDDELVRRWGAARPAAAVERTPSAAALLGGLDWRRAVLVSEVLAPPLALRGPGAAWPGPPASLTS